MTTIRIILLRSSVGGSWFLSRKAKELIDYYRVRPTELFFVYDSVEKIPLFASSLIKYRIPFIKVDNFGKIPKAGCILLSLESFYKMDIFPQGYFFFLLSRRLEEKRIDFVRHLKDENIKGAYLILCSRARQEGEDLSYLLNAEMVTDVEWRNPGTVYFEKENNHWRPYWQGVPNWMVPELLVRVADALARHQREFLERGFSGMAALTMKKIGSIAGCAESSVSRIIGGVEAETPWGRLPLKGFFSQKLPSKDGFTSQTSVMGKIARLIKSEDRRKPFSDEDIAEKMRLEGISIARRTITKYRQKLKIASTSGRKKDENNSPKAYPDGEAKKSVPIDTANRQITMTSKQSDTESKSPHIIFRPRKYDLDIRKPPRIETITSAAAEAYIEKGKRYEEDGNYELAILEYKRAIASNNSDGRAYLGAGINYERIGERKKAVSYYKIAVKLGNNEAIEFLRSMGIQ